MLPYTSNFKVLKYSEFGKTINVIVLPKKQTKYKDKVICFSTLNVCVLSIYVDRKLEKVPMKKGSWERFVTFSRVSHRLLNSSFHSYMTIKRGFSGSDGCRKNLESVSSQNQHTSKNIRIPSQLFSSSVT